jgi:hypothetical protein
MRHLAIKTALDTTPGGSAASEKLRTTAAG